MKDRIKQVRKALHLNQTEFGLLVGVKGNTIANYEIGLRTPSEAVLFSICREFNVNNQWLRTGEGDMFVTLGQGDTISQFMTKVYNDENANFKLKVLETIAQLDDEEWAVLERIVKKLHS